MLLACWVLYAFVSVEPPGDVEVQRPGQPPPSADRSLDSPEGPEAERMPSEGAEPVPADAEGGPVQPTTDPEPAAGGITPLGNGPAEPTPNGGDAGDTTDAGPITSWRDAAPPPNDVERPGSDDRYYAAPVYRGTGLFIVGGLAFGTVILKQALSPMFCDGDASLNCDSVGWIDRSMSAAAIGLVAGGGWKRGEWAATEGQKTIAADKLRKRKVAGWTLAGVGFAGAAVDMGLAIACWQDGNGPYAKVDDASPFVVTCRSTTTGLVVDAATIITATGMGLGLWANAYAKKRVATEARITNVSPIVSNDHWGVGLGGQF